MVHVEDNSRLSMIREETTILKVVEGVNLVLQSLEKLLVVTCKGKATCCMVARSILERYKVERQLILKETLF